jgi:hypothetical protein
MPSSGARVRPLFHQRRDATVPLEVGFYDPDLGRLDVRRHVDATEACADFIYREASWVLRRERVS